MSNIANTATTAEKKIFEFDYSKLRQVVKRACRETSISDSSFSIDPDRLDKNIEKFGLNLIPIILSEDSRQMEPEDIMFMSDYYGRNNKITWLDSYKEICSIILVQTNSGKYPDDVEANIDNIISLANCDDRVAGLAEIVNNYTCYYTIVVSYQSNDPRSYGKLTYDVRCRCNKRNAIYAKNTEPEEEEVTESVEEPVDVDTSGSMTETE